jgi:uncharacterized caspase-like protein
MAIRLLTAAAVVTLLTTDVMVAQERCAAARDLLTSGRARLQAGASRPLLEETLETFRRATELCTGLGDAYYFLSLLATELKDSARSENWRLKAEFYASPAMKRGEPLFPSAVPASTPPVAFVPAGPPVSPYVRQRLALVVGVGTFKDARINPLRFTATDAKAMADALRTDARFDYVKTLLDEEATTYNIKSEIDRLARLATRDDLVVIYFSSHGSPDTLDTAGINYIVTFDTEVNNLYASAYRMDDLTDDISLRLKAERVVAFLDTCYSGGTFRELPSGWAASSRSLSAERGTSVATLEQKLVSGARDLVLDAAPTKGAPQGVGRAIISASQQGERSWEADHLRHGYFTYYLLEALKLRSRLSVEDLYARLRERVPQAVRREKGESQNPTIARSRERVEIYLNERPR